MSWFNVWDGLKNKTCRYLLQRYLGQFLDERLNLEQLKIELYNGKATIKDVALRVEALNELLEGQSWPFEFTGGHVGVLTVSVPWNALMTTDSSIEASDVVLCVRPVKREHDDGTSMIESMWSSVSSSLQLAEECMRQDDADVESTSGMQQLNSIAGLEKFAETIDNVLNRINATFKNITLRIEYPLDRVKCIALNVFVNQLNYKNETGSEKCKNQGINTTSASGTGSAEDMHLLPTYAKHNINVNGIQIYTQESRLMDFDCRSPMANKNMQQIPILQFTGQQNIQIKVKQSEDIVGPKICFDVDLSAIYSFFSPRQIHLLTKLLEAFGNEQKQESSDGGANKIQKHFDYCEPQTMTMTNNIESRYMSLTSVAGGGLLSNNWGFSDDVGRTDPSTNYKRHARTCEEASYCDSMTTSISSNSTLTTASKYQRKAPNLDACGEISNFSIKIAGFVGVLLQEDILVEATSDHDDYGDDDDAATTELWNEQTFEEFLKISRNFFARLEEQDNSYEKDCATIGSYCAGKSHMLLKLYPILADGKQHRNKSILQFNTTVSASKFNICEVLDGQVTHLLEFSRNLFSPTNESVYVRPELQIDFSSVNTMQLKKNSSTSIGFTLEECCLDLDISIIDRLGCLFGQSPYQQDDEQHEQRQARRQYHASAINTQSTASKFEINLLCSKLDVHLKFPIVDLRPVYDPQRIPWWKQNIRSDFLLLQFLQFKIRNNKNVIKISASEIDVFYKEAHDKLKIHLLNTRMDFRELKTAANQTVCDYPEIILDFNSNLSCGNGESAATNKKSASRKPFSSKTTCRQSNTLYGSKIDDETELVLLPGESHEISEFCTKTMQNSKIKISVMLPKTDLFLESKQLYELIYNRFNTDLFMWEPSCPYLTRKSQPPTSNKPQMQQSLLNIGLMDSVYISAVQQQESDPFEEVFRNKQRNSAKKKTIKSPYSDEEIADDNDNDDDDEDEDNAAYSDIDESSNAKKFRGGSSSADQQQQQCNSKSHNCSVELKLSKASVHFFVPVRDSESHILPEICGKFSIYANDVRIFSVNGYENDLNLAYLCIQVRTLEMFHCAMVPMHIPFKFDYYSCTSGFPTAEDMEDFMHSTLYKIPLGLTKGIQPGSEKDMVSLVIELKKQPKQRIKRLKITAGIRNATLRYSIPSGPSSSANSSYWINQLIDFLNVDDYPIEGYQPFGVISEMQLHLWECAIDFRPQQFSYRAVVEIINFSVSSNIISSVPGCNLRFVLEECTLSLAPYEYKASEEPCFKITWCNCKELIPVLDIGLVDISLRLSEKESEKCPKFDLRCSIHDVHLRACYDSASALFQLIAHLANDSMNDNKQEEQHLSSSLQSSMSCESELFLSQTHAAADAISKEQQERVNLLMAEAVQEEEGEEQEEEDEESARNTQQAGRQVYYFPDDSNFSAKQDTEAQHANMLNSCHESFEPQVKADFGIVRTERRSSSATTLFDDHQFSSNDEDFCIIAEEEKVMPGNSSEFVKVCDDPLRIVDNHFFLPSKNNDLLQTPDSFPMPEQRFTLCEMTVTWHLYGGLDFANASKETETSSSSSSTAEKKPTAAENPTMSDAYRRGVSYAKDGASIQYGKKPKDKLTWKSKGGEQRNHEVLVEIQLTKARFSHEIYPLHTSHASRQVLLINEIEVRDRLQSSEINKFLYNANNKSSLAASKSQPNMLVIKALHIRPQPIDTTNQECSLRISLLPMRVHIDQDTLEFLADYFTSLGKSCDDADCAAARAGAAADSAECEAKKATSLAVQHHPIMTINEEQQQELPEAVQDLRARRIVNENLSLLIDEQQQSDTLSIHSDSTINTNTTTTTNTATHSTASSRQTGPIYFREVVFSPDVSIRFDYHGRRIELSKGKVAGLLMGLGQLQCSEIILRKIVYRRGLLGFDKLLNFLLNEWLKDIKRNQLPKILSGVGPTYAFVQLFQGIYDLFRLPIEHYQKDGRLIRGLQLGAQSFSARTILAALEITSRIVQLLQFTAETAFDMVSSGPSVRQTKKLKRTKKKRPNRPKDIREGVVNAYQIVKDGINDSANNLYETAVAEHDQKGLTGAVGAVMRQVPQLVVCPAVLATQATTNILGGVKSSLVPDSKIEAREKWKDDNC